MGCKYTYAPNSAAFLKIGRYNPSSGAAVDVCFLDIVLPEMNGIELAEELRNDGFSGAIVFLSTSKEYGPDAFAVKAFNYLLKPPTLDSVSNILRELEKAQKDSDTGGIMLVTASMKKFVPFRDISCAEVINHDMCFRLTDNSQVEYRATFSEIAPQLLSDTRFIRCHRSYIVNMDAVSHIEGSDFIMRSRAKIPITQSYPDVDMKYMQWVLGGSGKCRGSL